MTRIPHSYQIHYFANFSDIRPEGAIIPDLITSFSYLSLLPSTFEEIKLPNSTELRLQFTTPLTNEWLLQLESSRVIIQKTAIGPSGQNMGGVASFIKDASRMLELVIELHPRKGNCLSLVTSVLKEQMSEDRLEAINHRLLPHRTLSEQNRHTSGTALITREIGGRPERLNAHLAINRVKGQFANAHGHTDFDRIQLQAHISTLRGNTDARFSTSDMGDFLDHAKVIEKELHRQVASKLTDQRDGTETKN